MKSIVKAVPVSEQPVDSQQKLTGDQRSRLIKIAEAEFANQSTLHHSEIQEAKEKLLESLRKKVGHKALVNNVERTRAAYELAQAKLKKTGFHENGSVEELYCAGEGRNEVARINAKLDDVERSIRPAGNLLSKFITRLVVAHTYGQAVNIMRELIGNDILPAIPETELRVLP